MTLNRATSFLAGTILLTGLVTAVSLTHETWLPWLGFPRAVNEEDDATHLPAASSEIKQLQLTKGARSNLGLVSKPLQLASYWRAIQMPGTIVDRPAQTDRAVVAPVTGVVTKVYFVPGDTVRPGEALFKLRLMSESLQTTQSELFKTTEEIAITKDQKARLTRDNTSGVIPEARLIEVDNQLRRLTVAAHVHRQELLLRGMTPAQIEGVAGGKFVLEILVHAPQMARAEAKLLAGVLVQHPAAPANGVPNPAFEIQELKVELGQQVQAGQTLGLLSNHQSLYIEGRGFRQDAPFVEKALKEAWPVGVEFMEETGNAWPPLEKDFTIRHVANTIDSASRTFAFCLPLTNQSRTIDKDGRTLLLWRFRPGQKVRLHIKVEKFDNVFVLPADAMVREGPDAYVFQQNGDLFERRPVHALYEDRLNVVVANDGSITPGLYYAQSAAASLNRVLKAQNASGALPPGAHFHADGSLHIPGK